MPVHTYRRVARRIAGEVARRLASDAAPQAARYEGASITSGERSPDPKEIARRARDEVPADLTDLVMRCLGLGGPDQGLAQAPAIAGIAASHMGWSQAEAQARTYRDHLSRARRKPE